MATPENGPRSDVEGHRDWTPKTRPPRDFDPNYRTRVLAAIAIPLAPAVALAVQWGASRYEGDPAPTDIQTSIVQPGDTPQVTQLKPEAPPSPLVGTAH